MKVTPLDIPGALLIDPVCFAIAGDYSARHFMRNDTWKPVLTTICSRQLFSLSAGDVTRPSLSTAACPRKIGDGGPRYDL